MSQSLRGFGLKRQQELSYGGNRARRWPTMPAAGRRALVFLASPTAPCSSSPSPLPCPCPCAGSPPLQFHADPLHPGQDPRGPRGQPCLNFGWICRQGWVCGAGCVFEGRTALLQGSDGAGVGGWMSGCRNSPAAGALLECEAEPWSANGGHVFFPLGPLALRTRTHTQSCTPTALPD